MKALYAVGILVSAIALSTGAQAQVNTGGSNFTRMGVPNEGRVLEQRGRSGEFGCNNPWVPGSQHAPGCNRGYQPGPHYRGPNGGNFYHRFHQHHGYQQQYRQQYGYRHAAPPVPPPHLAIPQAPTGPVTRHRVPCAQGWQTAPDGTCYRIVR